MTAGGGSRKPLPAREAYPRWARTYDRETLISALDERAVTEMSPRPHAHRLLDAACGTARRLRAAAKFAHRAIGVDLVPEMLMTGRNAPGDGTAPPELAAGDLRALPFRSELFDLLWCRLAIGHVRDPAAVYSELARVSRAGATLVVTDFHPAAVAAGHVRSFRDEGGALHTILHHAHSDADQVAAASAAGWAVTAVRHFSPGPPERPFYEEAGRLSDYEAHRDLPLVLALCLTR